jgi:hypothetical protein
MSSRNCLLKQQTIVARLDTTRTTEPLDSVEAILTASPMPAILVASPTLTVSPIPTSAPKQLSPDRPEVLIQAYLAEKTTWLAQHPTIRLTEYRKARKWKTPRPKVLKEQVFYMPRERRDLVGSIIAEKANWTNEEIIVWLDNEERKEEEEYNRLELEFVRNGNWHTEDSSRGIWARLEKEHTRDAETYIL